MTEWEWGVRDTSGILGPEPFAMPDEATARREVRGDPQAVLMRRAMPGGTWEESR